MQHIKIHLAFFNRFMYNEHRGNKSGRLAQLVEHPLDVRKAMGSSPLASTKIISGRTRNGKIYFFPHGCLLSISI